MVDVQQESTAPSSSLVRDRAWRPGRLENKDLVESVDGARVEFFGALDPARRASLGQYGTPTAVAKLMASMFDSPGRNVRLLDAGGGVGSLTAAAVAEFCDRVDRPERIHVTVVEFQPELIGPLQRSLNLCEGYCADQGVRFEAELVDADFVEYAVRAESDLFAESRPRFTCAIQNPPYKKISSGSAHRKLLRRLGIEVSNIYAGFIALTLRLLEPGGQIVAITPRSFCNGPYFNQFRADFLSRTVLKRIHVFDSRSEAFGQDHVLQENVIFHAVVGRELPRAVRISSSGGPDADETILDVDYSSVVPPDASNPAIHVITDGTALAVAEQMQGFTSSLGADGLSISTGRVVDFRSKNALREVPGPEDAPLLYPGHLREAGTRWPVAGSKKPNAIQITAETQELLVPEGHYVLIKRFSAKEQRRRIDAYLCNSSELREGPIAFENHLNYIHEDGHGLDPDVAKGLVVYLNSTLVDLSFRLFSGHTQVNATDLRSMPFPPREALRALGAELDSVALTQEANDELLREHLLDMAGESTDPVASMKKVAEARQILRALGLPSAQSNVRSSLVLLSLLDLKQDVPWSAAGAPQLGITEMMDWFAAHYGKRYAPNSRETVRRQTVHQFVDAGLLVQNPDDPTRPVNSGKNVYQVVPEALVALRQFGASSWDAALTNYLGARSTLKEKYAQRRQMERVPVELADGQVLSLSPGGQNLLVKPIIDEFLPRFAPGSKLIYVGDTEDKWVHFDEAAFAELGLGGFDAHGKFPDVIAHYVEKDWLLLIEAVTSHGPVDPKRHGELSDLFGKSRAGLVYVTTFLTRRDMKKYLDEISWESEVWVADSPGHMIHFDGKRFLGPYGSTNE